MKLLDLFDDQKNVFKIEVDAYTGLKKDQLEKIKDFLPMFEEFSVCGSDFELADYPNFVRIDKHGTEGICSVSTFKLGDDFKIPKGAIIYAINRGPAVYDAKSFALRVGISQTIISEKDFVPYRYVTVRYNVDNDVDIVLGQGTLRKGLHAQLDEILDNPDRFTSVPVSAYGVFVRMWVPKGKA